MKDLRTGWFSVILNRDLKLVFASNLAGSFGDGLYSYILPYYVVTSLGAGSVEVGILYAVANLVAASTLFAAGRLADRFDRKKIMIAGWVAWVPAPIVFAFAGNWLQMLPGMILWGFWLGGPTNTAYVATSADKSKLASTFSVLSAAWSFGYVFSPALGGYLAGTSGMSTVFYLAFSLYATAALILAFISSQRARIPQTCVSAEKVSFLRLLRKKKLFRLTAFFSMIMFILMLFRPFVPQFLGEVYKYNDFEIGVLGSICFLGSAILGLGLGRIGDRWKKKHALALSLILCCSSLLLLFASDSFPVLAVAFFVTGGSYTTWSLMGAIVSPLADESIRARWVSVPQTFSMLSSFMAPYLGGVLYSLSPYSPFVVAVGATSVLAVLVFVKLPEE